MSDPRKRPSCTDPGGHQIFDDGRCTSCDWDSRADLHLAGCNASGARRCLCSVLMFVTTPSTPGRWDDSQAVARDEDPRA